MQVTGLLTGEQLSIRELERGGEKSQVRVQQSSIGGRVKVGVGGLQNPPIHNTQKLKYLPKSQYVNKGQRLSIKPVSIKYA